MKKDSEKEPVEETPTPTFQDGIKRGMYLCYELVDQEIQQLKTSSGIIWDTYNSGLMTPEKKMVVSQLTFGVDLLETLEDMIEGAYIDAFDSPPSTMEE